MAWIVAAMLLSGCEAIYLYVLGGEAPGLIAELHRASDGAVAFCDSGIYRDGGLISGEAKARRMVNACILECRKRGFVEDGPASDIDESASRLESGESRRITPPLCQR